eukprot:TRINITY_DN3641_c0_g1_i4.p1 TRINITY_DN3641_c0_g1~~TRINITY_DN3641_c0_g1_i4.p1  ORF type:complete len:512 (-),score=137.26 TRINITY_DN3641_c0_g1_i4:157-1692(-)
MAIKCFLGLAPPSQFTLINGDSPKEKMVVKDSMSKVRPYVVCGILRGMKFDEKNYNSFISLQDKLHSTVCRNRKFVAIGTHDYDTIKGPFSYEARDPKDIKFKPLNQTKEMTAVELMTLYETDLKLKEFLGLIRDFPIYPVIYDANGVTLSMPPIINGEHSKITLKTTNVLVECTAIDEAKASSVLNEVICAFSQYATPAFSAEAVNVVYSSRTEVYPKLQPWNVEVDLPYVHRVTGRSEITTGDCVELLKKMNLKSEVAGELLKVTVPAHRADILHKCDVAEDIAVAYGFNNLGMELPKVIGTSGKLLPLTKLSNELRKVCVAAKYNECLTLCLTSKANNFKNMNREVGPCVTLANPISKECDIARTSLLPGLIKCLKSNIDVKLPIRLFEIGDVVLIDPATETGTKNNKRLAALYCGLSSKFEYVHGLLDYIMTKLGIKAKSEDGYKLKIGSDPAFVNNAQIEILHKDKSIGVMGIIHPTVLAAFEVPYPISMLELDLDYLAKVFFHSE